MDEIGKCLELPDSNGSDLAEVTFRGTAVDSNQLQLVEADGSAARGPGSESAPATGNSALNADGENPIESPAPSEPFLPPNRSPSVPEESKFMFKMDEAKDPVDSRSRTLVAVENLYGSWAKVPAICQLPKSTPRQTFLKRCCEKEICSLEISCHGTMN